jgi:polyhydroxyalkanoate synthesis regulator phasin
MGALLRKQFMIGIGLPKAVANQGLPILLTSRGSTETMVEELEQEYAALRDKVHDLQEYL